MIWCERIIQHCVECAHRIALKPYHVGHDRSERFVYFVARFAPPHHRPNFVRHQHRDKARQKSLKVIRILCPGGLGGG
jgi:hypothetical protein